MVVVRTIVVGINEITTVMVIIRIIVIGIILIAIVAVILWGIEAQNAAKSRENRRAPAL